MTSTSFTDDILTGSTADGLASLATPDRTYADWTSKIFCPRRGFDDHGRVVIVRCPTGCGPLRRPYALRAEAVRCHNCTAWFAAAAETEDGSLVEGVLLARPGEALAVAVPPRRVAWLALIAAALALALAAAALARQLAW